MKYLKFGIGPDGPKSGTPRNSNKDCSSGPGHERNNPEHTKVCKEQSNY